MCGADIIDRQYLLKIISRRFAGQENRSDPVSLLWSIQVDRDDGFEFSNKLILELKDQSGSPVLCGGKQHVYIENSSDAYAGAISVVLASIATGKN